VAYVDYPCRAARDPNERVRLSPEGMGGALSTRGADQRSGLYPEGVTGQPTNGRLYPPKVSQGSRPTVGSTPEGVTGKPTNGRLYHRRCHRAADQRSALPPEGVTGKPTSGRLYPQRHTQTKTAPSRAPFWCVSCCPRHARASRDARLRLRRRLHAAPALPSVWPVHAGIPQPLRSALPPALPAGEPPRWPLRPGQHSAGWHRPSEPPSG